MTTEAKTLYTTYRTKVPEMYARLEWCKKVMGEPGVRWWRKKGFIHFANEKDLLMFRMRWAKL